MRLEWLPRGCAGRLKTTGHGVGKPHRLRREADQHDIQEVIVPPNRRRQGCLNDTPRPPDPWLPLPFGISEISPRAKGLPLIGAAPLLLAGSRRWHRTSRVPLLSPVS